jgi:hypothetical protein
MSTAIVVLGMNIAGKEIAIAIAIVAVIVAASYWFLR